MRVIKKLGDDVSTDVIYPGRFMATVLPSETPQHAFADDADLNAQLRTKAFPDGAVIAAGKNFGCGSSREQAVSALKGHELTIVAQGVARIFLQNAVNLGLRVVIAPGFEASEGDALAIEDGEVINKISGARTPITPLPRSRQVILEAGGLIPYTRKRLLAGARE